MKKISYILLTLLLLTGCKKYDDSAIKDDMNNLKNRIATLETLCTRLNANISSMQTIAEGLQSDKYLTDVTPIAESGITVGYMLTYNDNTTIELRNGSDGATGDKGTDGAVPAVSIVLHDGVYCWALNGELILVDGKPIQATGANGANGNTATVPQIRINTDTNNWEISHDGGVKWAVLGMADGADGVNRFFRAIDNSSPDRFSITFPDGSSVSIPKTCLITISTSAGSATMAPNATADVAYTLSGQFDTASIETIVSEKGWRAEVIAADKASGVVRITAPDRESSAEVLIIVCNNRYSTAMRKLTVVSQL